jgi:hypothetical protein
MPKVNKKKVKSNLNKTQGLVGSNLYTSLTSISFVFKGKKYEVDIGGELLVDEEDLHSQVERIPAVLGYFGSICAMLYREHQDKKALFKKIEAQIDKKIRETGVIGETRITKAVRRHPKWIEACMEVNKAAERSNKATRLWASLKEKAIILLSRSSDIRVTPSDGIRGVIREEVIGLMDNYARDLDNEEDDEE